MQRFKARVTRDAGGEWIASAVELPSCASRGRDAAEALARLRQEIRYRIEYCPCTGVDDEFVQLEVVPSRVAPGTAAGPASIPGAPSGTPSPARRTRRWDD